MSSSLRLILVSTPIGFIGSGKGGGVELTISSLTKGLLSLGHEVTLVAPEGSFIPSSCSGARLIHVKGASQDSWQHMDSSSSITIPSDGVLPNLWSKALELGATADAVLNFSYDWLPIWLTKKVCVNIFHLISMGGVSDVMTNLINEMATKYPRNFAFHTHRQAEDYKLSLLPTVLGNGFDLEKYELQLLKGGPLGWAGRIAPEKGLEDAVEVAVAVGSRLLVWGLVEDEEYAKEVELNVPKGIIEWRGFLPTDKFQKELGLCRALINTPKWNEAYGNVVVEALACGVPIIAYDRGGPGELIASGVTGWLVPPDDVKAMISATSRIDEIDRMQCRKWAANSASLDIFARRVIEWIKLGSVQKTFESQ